MNTGLGASTSGKNSSDPRLVWTPSSLNRAITDALAARFGSITLDGELSGLTRAASGHWYFSLKDAGAQLRCAMFRTRNALVNFTPRDGMQVRVRATVNIYEPRGELQVLVESMQQAGLGELYERFLRLKSLLQAEGLFAEARKRTIARVPRCVAVVTSLQAAALRDVLTALARRAPHVQVRIFPASVQGALAPAELARALRAATQSVGGIEADTVLLVRGGGSMEDLWAFNDEALAREIVACRVPVISGVGHETDFTIADFCADLRAPTPTAAAELCATPLADLQSELNGSHAALQSLLERRLLRAHQQLDRAELALAQLARRAQTEQSRTATLAARLGAARDARLAREHALLGGFADRLARIPHLLVAEARRKHERSARAQSRLASAMQSLAARSHARLTGLERTLDALSPKRTFERGYSALVGKDGKVIRDTTTLRAQQRVRALLADGEQELLLPNVPQQLTF
jgi:exodeoxyribonuclease VII large subunit